MSDAATLRSAKLATVPLVPSGPRSGFVRGTLGSIKGVWEYREVLDLLVRRELKSRYKDSALGFLWSLVRPLMTMIVYVVAIGLFLGASYNSITKTGTVDFPVYIFSGLTAWNLFSEIVGVGTGAIINNGGLVKKIYLPREVFPLSVIGSALFNFCIQILILYAATWFTSFHPNPRELAWAVLGTAHWSWSGPRRWHSFCRRSMSTCETLHIWSRSSCCSASGSPQWYTSGRPSRTT